MNHNFFSIQLPIIVFWVLFPLWILSQITGQVYWDYNKNGIRDTGESGMEGAVVSDGYHVVRTDKDGHFELPGWKKERLITLYPGSDFKPLRRYIWISDVQDGYDFPIVPIVEKEEITFLHISDTETYEFGDWVDNLKKYIRVHQPDFVVHTGDICYRSGMEWHARHLTEETLRVPIYYCLGNHDLIKGDYGEQFFESRFGPAWYALERGGNLYVITPMMGGDYPPGFDHEDIGGWLENLLAVYDKEQPKLFFNHDLLSNTSEFIFDKNEQELINLGDYNLKGWFYGHWHINKYREHGSSGIKSYSTATLAKGGIDHSPSSFREVKVDKKGDIESKMIWTYVERQINIISPSEGQAITNDSGRVRVSVNIYDSGSAVDSVRCGIWGEEENTWTTALDPSRWQNMKPTSDWNWELDYDPGKEENITMVVDACLASGEVLHRKERFMVEKRDVDKVVIADWQNLGGNPAHDAVVINHQNPPYELKWSGNLGTNIYMSSPVLTDSRIMTAGFDDGNGKETYIQCRDATAGNVLWKVDTDHGIKNQMVISQGMLLATDVEGITYAINIKDGHLVWKRDLDYQGIPAILTGLVTDGDILYTGFSDALSAIRVKTGEVIWRNSTWSGGEGTTPTMTIADSILIASRHWGAIYAHDRYTGELLWTRSDDGLRFRDGVLAYVDGYLWVAERDGQGEGKLHQMDVRTGKTIWSFPTGMQNTGTSAPIILEDRIIIAGSHPGIASFDRSTGKKIWEFEVGPALFYTPSYFSDQQQSIETTPVLVGEHLIFGAMDGVVYVLEADTGRLAWKTSLGAPVMTTIAPVENGFYVCDFAGNIYYFKSKK